MTEYPRNVKKKKNTQQGYTKRIEGPQMYFSQKKNSTEKLQ